MPKVGSETANKTRQMKWKQAEHPTVYSNVLGIGTTPFDITVIFGEVTEADENSVTGTPRVKVLLAPEVAVNLMKMLSVAVDSYTKTNGAIRTAGAVDVAEMARTIEASRSKVN